LPALKNRCDLVSQPLAHASDCTAARQRKSFPDHANTKPFHTPDNAGTMMDLKYNGKGAS
jgi:hypothetical protein